MNIVSRAQWGARPPKSRLTIATPSRDLWLHHTAGSERGAAGMRQIQNFHMDKRGWTDIAYSFIIDPYDLTVYEGRGPGVSGAHTKGHNTTSHAICVMGNFDQQTAHDTLVRRIAELVGHGHRQGWWPSKLSGGHRDVGSTSCPGTNLYRRIGDINRMEAVMADHKHSVNPSSLPRGWADTSWKTWVEASGTDPNSRTWEFYREDLSWVYERVIRPLEARCAALEKRVAALEAGGASGGLTRSQADKLYVPRGATVTLP